MLVLAEGLRSQRANINNTEAPGFIGIYGKRDDFTARFPSPAVFIGHIGCSSKNIRLYWKDVAETSQLIYIA